MNVCWAVSRDPFNPGTLEWIDLQDEWPDEDEIVLVYPDKYFEVAVAYSNGKDRYFTDIRTNERLKDVTHWLPIPETP